jgi:hypothetical protein
MVTEVTGLDGVTLRTCASSGNGVVDEGKSIGNEARYAPRCS